MKSNYDFACYKCGYEMSFSPSIAMRQGQNLGHGKCSSCGEMLQLGISKRNKGYSVKLDDVIKQELGRTKWKLLSAIWRIVEYVMRALRLR